MRKRVSIILALLLALVISMPLSVFAAAEYYVDIPVAAELNTETDTPSDPAEGEGTDGKTEPADIPTGQGELGENEYYYITPEELETYRTQFTVISPGDLFLANLTEGGMALGSLFLPLLSPLMWFVPFGPIIAGAMIFAPVQVISNYFETAIGTIYYIFHAKEIKDSFSADNLYASPVYEIDDASGDSVFKGYEINYMAEPGGVISSDCRRVRVAE